jgi:hypothetical protein
MRTILFKAVITVLFALQMQQSAAQPVAIVRDPYKNRQLENMVFMRWGDFRPRWYYLLFHNKYRRGPDRRTLLQLAPTDLVLIQTRNKSEETEDETTQMHEMQTIDALNRLSETHYHLHFKALFQQLNAEIDQLITIAVSIGAHPAATGSFIKEQQRLNGEIDIIRNGWLEKGESVEAMQEIEADFRTLKGRISRFNYLHAIGMKYQHATLKPDMP